MPSKRLLTYRAKRLAAIKIPDKIKPQASNGAEYKEIRKVKFDDMWHAYYDTYDGKESYDRVDKSTALFIADLI